MNQTEARELLTKLQWTIQKVRSNTFEYIGTDEAAKAIYEDLHPDILGEDPVLFKAVNMVLNKSEIPGGDLYNLFFMANKNIILQTGFRVLYEEDMPQPDIKWLTDLGI